MSENVHRRHLLTNIDPDEFSKRFFIGIGAARSGTTWLEAILRHHPQISLSKVKELQYFNWAMLPDEQLSFTTRMLLGLKKISTPKPVQERLLNVFYEDNRIRRELLRGQPNHQWYLSLFSNTSVGRMCGEFTPAYAALPEWLIAEMARLLPHARLVYVMRDPIERIWSHYRYRIGKGLMSLSDIAGEPDVYYSNLTTYLETIENYEKAFSSEQIFCGYYEEFTSDPEQYFNLLCEFLGVNPINEPMKKLLSERINASKQDDACPPELTAQLHERFGHIADQMEDKLGRVPPSWRRRF